MRLAYAEPRSMARTSDGSARRTGHPIAVRGELRWQRIDDGRRAFDVPEDDATTAPSSIGHMRQRARVLGKPGLREVQLTLRVQRNTDRGANVRQAASSVVVAIDVGMHDTAIPHDDVATETPVSPCSGLRTVVEGMNEVVVPDAVGELDVAAVCCPIRFWRMRPFYMHAHAQPFERTARIIIGRWDDSPEVAVPGRGIGQHGRRSASDCVQRDNAEHGARDAMYGRHKRATQLIDRIATLHDHSPEAKRTGERVA